MTVADVKTRAAAGLTLVETDVANSTMVRRMFGVAWQFRRRCLKVVTLQVLLLIMQLSGLGLTGLAVQIVVFKIDADHNKPPSWPLGIHPPATWGTLAAVTAVAGAIVAFALTRAVLNYHYTVTQGQLIQDIIVNLRARVYDKLQRLSFRFFDANESGSIINRVTGDVQAVRMFVDGVIIQGVNLLITLAIYITYMVNINAGLTLWCLLSTPVLMLTAVMFSKIVRPAFLRNRTLVDRLILTLTENVYGVHVVRGFAREPEEIEKFRGRNDHVLEQQRWVFWKDGLFTPAIGFMTQVNLIILLGYGGYLAIHLNPATGKPVLGVGDGLLVFAVLLMQFSNQVSGITQLSNSVQQSLTGAQRVFEVLDAPVEIENPPQPVRMPRSKGAVRFENVTFGYNPLDPVIFDVDFTVEPGKCVAIVGATGSGKSTIMSLIPRFYDPQKGRVLIDSVDVRQIDLDDLRRNVGMVFQESFLFSNTVAANIAFGHPDATRQQIENAARIAAADGFIRELKNGYDTYIGERGADLSGGQRQRLAIARAVLLEPSILLLDDPTAAIDPQTEHEIMQAMDSAMRDRTTFVVAHRLSTLRRADMVLVLEQGRIVQRGTHEQLMAEKGHYRRAARLQIADPESLALLGLGVETEAPV